MASVLTDEQRSAARQLFRECKPHPRDTGPRTREVYKKLFGAEMDTHSDLERQDIVGELLRIDKEIGALGEIRLPWAVAVTFLKFHVINRLVRKHGMPPAEAAARQVAALQEYDELIDQIMKDLIADWSSELNRQETERGLSPEVDNTTNSKE